MKATGTGGSVGEMSGKKVRVGLVGVGNCASALLQGIQLFQHATKATIPGIARRTIGGLEPGDVEIVAALDIDRRKVGLDLAEAVLAPPNCTTIFNANLRKTSVEVVAGKALDGVGKAVGRGALRAIEPVSSGGLDPSRIKQLWCDRGVEVVVNFLPTGAEQATRFYAECALEAGAAFVNCIPVFIASDPSWARRFAERGLPLLGDDVKSQLGATVLHRALVELCRARGIELDRTYQLNVGGNSDFANMLDRDRLSSKSVSKTEAVQSAAAERLDEESIHVGPSDFVPWLRDNKVAYVRLEGRLFGGAPINMEVRLSVEDSPNSAGVVIDAIRCAKLALSRGEKGAIVVPSSCFFKHPPQQVDEPIAQRELESWIAESQ